MASVNTKSQQIRVADRCLKNQCIYHGDRPCSKTSAHCIFIVVDAIQTK